MKFKKLVSLFAVTTMLSSVLAVAPVHADAAVKLYIDSEAASSYDRTGLKAYTVTYSIAGNDIKSTYKTDYIADDGIWTLTSTGTGLLAFGVKYATVSDAAVDDRSFGLTTGTTKTKTFGWVQNDTLMSFNENTFKNGIIAYAGSPIAVHTVKFNEEEGLDGWTDGGTITATGKAPFVKTVWYVAENAGYTIDYALSDISVNYGTTASSTKYVGGSTLDVYINGTKVDADTAKLTLGTSTPAINYPTAVAITNAPAAALNINDEVQLGANVTGGDEDQKTVTWTSSDAETVSVDSTGKIKALKATTTPVVITATVKTGAETTTSDTVEITVNQPTPPAFEFTCGTPWNNENGFVWAGCTMRNIGAGKTYTAKFTATGVADPYTKALDLNSKTEADGTITFDAVLNTTKTGVTFEVVED